MADYWIDKREGERVKVAMAEYEGRQYIDIRLFYQSKEGDWRPTQKGVTLPPEKLPELKAAVDGLVEQ